jgi:hypothetical protein
MKAIEIDWDIDRDDYIDLNEQDLLPPKIVVIPDGIEKDDVADWLSDTYGWCVNSFLLTDIKRSDK